jgi:hypothetical protein
MIQITAASSQSIYFTGTEQALLTDPYFLFVCTHRETKEVIKFVGTNTSSYKYRYDKVTITDQFEDQPSGYYTYQIYEQASSTNLVTTGLNLVEEGILNVVIEDFAPTKYEGQNNTTKSYQ